jgi:hypothetical protein
MATTVPNTFVNGTNADATQMNANFAAVTAAVDGVAAAAGVTTPAPKMRGMSSVAGAENRVSAAYGLMATPDRVTGIVLPTNGLLVVTFQAWWNESVSAAARAAIFLGSNQLKIASNTASAPSVQEAGTNGGTVGQSVPLVSYGGGLASAPPAATGYTADVTTGQAVGLASSANVATWGSCRIFAAAGTYDVSVQFKATSGSVTVAGRKLWVEAIAY